MTNEALQTLRTAISAAVGATQVYIGDLPELGENCVAFRPVDGYPSTVYLGMPETLEPLVEVIVRDEDYASGTDNCNNSMKALDGFVDETVGILLTKVVGSPGYLGRNTNGFGEWHFIVHITLTSL